LTFGVLTLQEDLNWN